MPRILFVRDTHPDEHGNGAGFKKGQTVSLTETSAVHWQHLGAAVEAAPEPPGEAAPARAPAFQAPAAPAGGGDPTGSSSPPQSQGAGGAGDETDDSQTTSGDAAAAAEAELKRLAAIEIVPAWKNMPVPRRLALASEISGKDITDKGEADAAIAMEVARRDGK